MSYRVLIQPQAERQAAELDAWWNENRSGSRVRVRAELERLLTRLSFFPERFARYRDREERMVRLEGTPYYAFYRVKPAAKEVHIVSVWSAVLDDAPPF